MAAETPEAQPTIESTLGALHAHFKAGDKLNIPGFLKTVYQVKELGHDQNPTVINLLKTLGVARREAIGNSVVGVLEQAHQTGDVAEIRRNVAALRMLGLDQLPDVGNLIDVLTRAHRLELSESEVLETPAMILPEPSPVEAGARRVNIGFADLVLADRSTFTYNSPLSDSSRNYLVNVLKVIGPTRVDNYLRDNPILALWANTDYYIEERALARLTPAEVRAYFGTKPNHILTIPNYPMSQLSLKAREELEAIAVQITPEGLTQSLRTNPLLAYQIRNYEFLDPTQKEQMWRVVKEAQGSEDQRERVRELVEKDPSLLLGLNWDRFTLYSSTYFLEEIAYSAHFVYQGEIGKVASNVSMTQSERQAVLSLKKAAGTILEKGRRDPSSQTSMAEFERIANLPASERSSVIHQEQAVFDAVRGERYNLDFRLDHNFGNVAPILQQVFTANSQPVLAEALERVRVAREAWDSQDYMSGERKAFESSIVDLDDLIGGMAGITEQDRRKARVLRGEVAFWEDHSRWDLLRALAKSAFLDPSLGRDIIDATRAYNRAQLEDLRFQTQLDVRWNKVFTGFLKKAGYKLEKTGYRNPMIVPKTRKDKILDKLRSN